MRGRRTRESKLRERMDGGSVKISSVSLLSRIGSSPSRSYSGKAQRTEQRRQGREHDRTSNTICFACRGKGHAAKDCPNVLLAAEKTELESVNADAADTVEETRGLKRKKGKKGADLAGSSGRCYRYVMPRTFRIMIAQPWTDATRPNTRSPGVRNRPRSGSRSPTASSASKRATLHPSVPPIRAGSTRTADHVKSAGAFSTAPKTARMINAARHRPHQH